MTIPILSRPAALNNWASGEYARGRRERKVGAILHWMAGYLPGTTRLFQDPATGYATNLGVGSRDGWGNDLEVHRYVPDDGYAYGSYNSYADRLAESIEIENDRNLPYPGKPTPAVHELVAQLLAQLCLEEDWPLIGGKRQLVLGDFPDHRYYQRDIPGLGVDFNITTHRSMALKDCPGTTDVQWIVDRGNAILSGTTQTENDTIGDDMLIYLPTSDSEDGVIKKGLSYISDGGPIRPLSRDEYGAYAYFDDPAKVAAAGFNLVPVRWVRWAGELIRNATRYVGVLEHSGIAKGDVPILTGRVIYDDPAAPTFPRVTVA